MRSFAVAVAAAFASITSALGGDGFFANSLASSVASSSVNDRALFTIWPASAPSDKSGESASSEPQALEAQEEERELTRHVEHRDQTHRRTFTSSTVTTSTSSTSTSTTGPHVFGGKPTEEAFYGWLSVWRSKYQIGVWNANLTDPWESLLPKDLRGHPTRVVQSHGGAAGGVVTEGMGYGIMIEGLLAANGNKTALNLSLSMIKSWLAMVNGPDTAVQPLGGGMNATGSATQVNTWPYGISTVEWSHFKTGPAGVPAWKFPIDNAHIEGNEGSAADGDQDAVLGMVYTAKALGYPDDFVDMVIRTIISFASADLGFPDLYRTLPHGEKVYVPKLGSMWGGLLPPGGKYKTAQQAWCYSPGYFAPAHYRTFRDFLIKHWQKDFDDYMPPHSDGSPTTLDEMVQAFNSAIVSGYNLLWYSSCSSGTVSNWVGVKAPCEDEDALNCPGVPWAHTPYIGAEGGTCSSSGTEFGAFGADASRTAWRVAMDYVLYREESSRITIYDRQGSPDLEEIFGARRYLNRIVEQYRSSSTCDGGELGSCFRNTTSPYRMANAFDLKFNATHTTCHGVPNEPESWWAGFMAYPTFTAFVAPYDEIGAEQMTNWMDTFSSICNFSKVDVTDFTLGEEPEGAICLTSYFEASQAVISTMIMAGFVSPLEQESFSQAREKVKILKDEILPVLERVSASNAWLPPALGALGALAAMSMAAIRRRQRTSSAYSHLAEELPKSPSASGACESA